MVLKKHLNNLGVRSSTTEAIEGPALPLQGIHNIHSSHGLPPSMLSIGHSITDNVLKENLQDATGLFVDQAGNTFDTATTSKAPNGRLGDTLDVITKHLPVTLGASLSQTLTTLTASRHVVNFVANKKKSCYVT